MRNRCATGRGTSGFTLVEIVVVIGVIGVLIAIAVPVMLRARTNARIQRAKVEVEMIAAAVRQLAWDTGRWPGGATRTTPQIIEVWDLSTGAAGLLSNDGRFPNWKGPYIPEVINDPWGNKYFFDPDYRIGGQWKVAVGSFGPNGMGRNWYDEDNIYLVIQK
jgi:general secretion pathway protein G